MQKSFSKWIDFLYGPFFRVIGFFYRIFVANRRRVAEFKSHRNVAVALRFLAIAVLVGWMLIWFFASDESRTRLTDEIEKSLGDFGSTADQ